MQQRNLKSLLWHHVTAVSFSDLQSQHVKKFTRELTGKIKSVSSRRETHKFPTETVHTVPGCVLLCAVPDQLGPFSQLINFKV